MATERDHRGRSIVRGVLDLDDVSPDGCNVQGLRHAGRPCARSFTNNISLRRQVKSVRRQPPGLTAVASHPLKIRHMFICTRNSPYYHLLKYLLFLLKHRMYIHIFSVLRQGHSLFQI